MSVCVTPTHSRCIVRRMAENASTPGQVVKPANLSVPRGKAKIVKLGQTHTNAWGADYMATGEIPPVSENPPL